ncbi:MAG: DNA starvation/stationary phase protection protein [Chlamydiota bacterium]
MKINIGIDQKNFKKLHTLLNNLLADEYTLYTKTLNYHWNILGVQFHDLHLFFRGHYEELFQIVDDTAERARTIGAWAFGTLQEFQKNTQLKEKPGIVPSAKDMIKHLLDDHETIIRSLRKNIETCESYQDSGTANFLTDLLEKHEKMAWMLRTFLES